MSTSRVSWADRMNKVRKVSEGGSEAEPEAEHEGGELMQRLNWTLKAEGESGPLEETVAAVSSEAQASEEADTVAGTSSRTPNVNTPRCEALDLHWLLKTANPNWTAKELSSAKDKLNQAGIISYSDLDEALQGKGILNNRLRDQGFKAFGISTLERLRNAVVSERERQRQANLLLVQRERRRLDQESKVSMEPPTNVRSSVEPPARAAVEPPTRSASSDAGPETADTTEQEPPQSNDSRPPPAAASDSAGLPVVPAAEEDAAQATTTEATAVVVEDNSADNGNSEVSEDNRSDASGQFPSPFFTASSQFRSGLSDRLSCGRSWEWPLTREEKKERVRMLDLEVLQSYKKELDELKAKVDTRGQKDDIESEDEGDGSSESGLSGPLCETLDSELGIHIAG